MNDELNELIRRKEEIENKAVASSKRSSLAPIALTAALTGGVAVGGFLIYDQLRPEVQVEPSIATSEALEFPDDRDAGENLELPSVPTPITIERPVVQEVTDSATLQRLEDLEAELAIARAEANDASASATEAERLLREELERERERFAQEISALTSSATNDQDRSREIQDALRNQLNDIQRQYDSERNSWATEKLRLETTSSDELNALNRRISNMEQDFEAEKLRQLRDFEEKLAAANAIDPLEEQRLAQNAERLALEAEERRRFEALREEREAELSARINSGMVALSNNSTHEAGAVGERDISGNEAFVRRGLQPVPVSQAQVISNPEATILQGTIIQASLETAIDSSLPGQIRAVVNEHIYSVDGSSILIPAGSKVFGEYNDGIELGQRRVLIAWTRIMTPNNRSISIASFGGDRLGRSGTGGTVDTRFGARFGSAAMISIIGAAPALLAQNATDNANTAEALENVGDDFSNATGNAIGNVLSIRPSIYVKQGSAVSIILDRDLEIF